MYKFTYDPVMIFPFFADESMSQSGCYCCNPVPAGMDVDSALHELGMIDRGCISAYMYEILVEKTQCRNYIK